MPIPSDLSQVFEEASALCRVFSAELVSIGDMVIQWKSMDMPIVTFYATVTRLSIVFFRAGSQDHRDEPHCFGTTGRRAKTLHFCGLKDSTKMTVTASVSMENGP